MNFIYSVSLKNNLTNKFIINTDRKLTDHEVKNLKNNPKAFEKFKNDKKELITLDLKDLNIEILPPVATENAVTVTQIAVSGIKKLQPPALITRLENLLLAWPAQIPVIQFIWKLLLAPLIFICRFINKNRDKTLQSLERLETSFDYNNANDFLQDYHSHLHTLITRLEDNNNEKISQVKEYLIEMKRQASLIEKNLKNSDKVLYNLSRDLVKEAGQKLKKAEAGKETAIMSLPAGFYQKNGRYQPMLATFYLEADKKLRLDLNCLGNPSFEHLQQSYRFENPSSTLLADLTHQLCILSSPLKKGKSLRLSYREKIRLKVANQFSKDNTQASPPNLQDFKKFNASQWLHESLCVKGGTPLKVPVEENLDRTMRGIIGQDLVHFFPEVPLQDKMEFLIKLIEEHYTRFIAAQPYLTEAKQARQLELLKFKVKKLEDYLAKRMDSNDFNQLRKVNHAFDHFFKKIDQLESSKAKIQKSYRAKKASQIDRGMIIQSNHYKFKANNIVKKPLEETGEVTKKEDVLAPYKDDLVHLRNAVQTLNYKSVDDLLHKIRDKADRLIDKKEYYVAKQLSIHALECLPIPKNQNENFWKKDQFLIHKLNIVDLNMIIWESSLRLQDPAPERNQLLQMIKSQLIIAYMTGNDHVHGVHLDKNELLDILKLHPHYRFGWLPSQLDEVKQILAFLEHINDQDHRIDLLATMDPYKINSNSGMEILQFTLTCLMKPEYVLYPFFGEGRVNEALGITYLDSLVKRAVESGATTAKEKSDMIRAIKYDDVQSRLKTMGRLRFTPGTFGTGKKCVKIHDKFSFLKGGLAYLPSGAWPYYLNTYNKKYNFLNNQSNTQDLVGAVRGEEKYLVKADNAGLRKRSGFVFDEKVGTLSPQKGASEPTLLQRNLAKDPKGQINQVANFALETVQIANNEEAEGQVDLPDYKEKLLSYTSTYEILNLIRTHTYLLNDLEFQKTIFLSITRPEFISKAIEANPLYFEILADDIQKIMQKKMEEKGVIPFLMLLSDTIQEHGSKIENPPNNLQDILKKLPGFDAKITLGDIEKTGYEWLHEWMIDPEKDLASIGLAFMYSSFKKPLAEIQSTSDLALLYHSATIFQNSADSIGIPIFNREINQWIRQSLTPHILKLCKEKEGFHANFLNDWIRLSTGNPGYSSMHWQKKQDGVYENDDYTIDIDILHIKTKKKQNQSEGFAIDLPLPVAHSMTKLFGLDPIHAKLRKGKSISENYYDFQYQNQSYTIFYNQANGEIKVYRRLPLDLKKPDGKQEWFQYIPQEVPKDENLSGIELLIGKNGLWVNTQNPKKAFLFVNTPSEGIKENPYSVSLNTDGSIDQIFDSIASLKVVLDKNQRYAETLPFANPNETVYLACMTSNVVKEVRFLNDGSTLERKGRGKWVYHNELLGEGYRWLTDLSDEQLVLRDRSSAKNFLNSLGEMHEQFIFPLTNGKTHTFMIQPYKIQAEKGLTGINFNHNEKAIKGNLPPLTIHFDENGKMEGTPAAFLYLAYYFSHKKNYQLAEHYLNKAKNAAGTTAADAAAVNGLEKLFDEISLKSLRNVAFQLKAQLAIKHIKTHQLGKTVYEPSSAAEFLYNLQHIAKLNDIYEKRQHELKEGTLTEEERYQIHHYVKMSMQNYVKKYQELEDKKTETMDVDFDEFEYFKQETPEDLNVLKLLLIADLKEKPSINELVKKRNPDPDYILRNFFNFIIATIHCTAEVKGSYSPEERKKIERNNKLNLHKLQLFISAPKSWELNPPKNQEELADIQMAQFACAYLQAFLENPRWDKAEGQTLYATLKKLKSNLPYFDRNLGPITAVYDIIKVTINKVEGVNEGLKSELRTGLKIEPYEDKKGTYDPRKTGKHITSLNAVLEVLEKDKPDFLSPFEAQHIPEMIKAGDFNLEQPRELLALLRDSEARQFSALEMRNETETLRKINKLKQQIKDRHIDKQIILPDYNLELISKSFVDMRKAFPSPFITDDKIIQEGAKALKKKVRDLKEYFKADNEKKKTHIEENNQLNIGLDLAEKKLSEEIKLKTTFTKKEMVELKQSITKQLITLKDNDFNERLKLLEKVRKLEINDPVLKKVIQQTEIYTEYDLFNEVLKAYKDPKRAKALGDMQQELTTYLFKYTALLQFKKAKDLLDSKLDEGNAAKALQMVHAGLNEKRYQEHSIENFVMRICLVAEAREGIIYRKAQLVTLQKIKENPNKWFSLIMGIGKTSYIMPTVAEMLAKLGNFVVWTVPESLFKGNRQSSDRSSRLLCDQESIEFSIPLTEELSYSYLAEKYAQLLDIIDKGGYVVTTVEELCSLHNIMIQLEEEKRKLVKKEMNDENGKKLLHIEKKLHYMREISKLMHDEAENLNIERQLLSDEVDTTNDITHEVNLAVGKVVDPNKIVRDSVRALLELILKSKKDSPLYGLKKSLLADSQSILNDQELEKYMFECAKAIKTDPTFSKLFGPELSKIISQLNDEDWAGYMTGKSSIRPAELGEWEENNNGKKYISALKQLLTSTLKSLLNMKSGNEFGFSDYQGFLAVPKITKNETLGMRYGDEFEMITAQYLGYLESLPCQSLTDASSTFLKAALKTYQNKYPTKYAQLIADFTIFQAKKEDRSKVSLIEYLQMPIAWKHRFNVLDEITFDGGYIKRFNRQITTNVQEVNQGKRKGGMTGTLDPYTLPFISHEVQFHQDNKGEKTSTREVEAETLLRLTMNLPEGIHKKVKIYDSKDALNYVEKNILESKETKAFVNNIGATSEGLDTLAWIAKLRETREGKQRSYLFLHPKFRIPYLWTANSNEPLPYKNQKLPENCIRMYAPSDTRGVDLYIDKGAVHVLLGATTSLPELMQTLYRARQIGTLHKIILHVSKEWEKQIQPLDPAKGITYGDIVKYIVSRTADKKESINESAQLTKIHGRLKAVVSRYLRQTNPKFNQVEFWDKDNIVEFGMYVYQEAEIFSAIRKLYIKKKQIVFKDYYESVEKIKGTEKLLNAYDELKEAINDAIEKLPDDIELEGKTNLREDLEKLLIEIQEEKEKAKEWLPLHERFLPEETPKATLGSKNVKETVKELQLQKVAQQQQEEQPLKAQAAEEKPREYLPLDFDGLFEGIAPINHHIAHDPLFNNPFQIPDDLFERRIPIAAVKPIELDSPFNHLFISSEAQEILKKYGTRRGDPLLYLVMGKKKNDPIPRITLVSKMDYHSVIFPSLRSGKAEDKELYVYTLNMHHFSQVDGTSKNNDEIPDLFLGAKCYLGFKEYDLEEQKKLKAWVNSLGDRKHLLLSYLKENATQSLYDMVDNLIQLKN